jgi:hypothetical protein
VVSRRAARAGRTVRCSSHCISCERRNLTTVRDRVRDTERRIWQFSFFARIILTYAYVRSGGAFCLSPSPLSNSSVPAS